MMIGRDSVQTAAAAGTATALAACDATAAAAPLQWKRFPANVDVLTTAMNALPRRWPGDHYNTRPEDFVACMRDRARGAHFESLFERLVGPFKASRRRRTD